MPAAVTLRAASRATVNQDTIEMDLLAQVSQLTPVFQRQYKFYCSLEKNVRIHIA